MVDSVYFEGTVFMKPALLELKKTFTGIYKHAYINNMYIFILWLFFSLTFTHDFFHQGCPMKFKGKVGAKICNFP